MFTANPQEVVQQVRKNRKLTKKYTANRRSRVCA